MLRQEELAFLKAIGSIELSPVFLQELRKGVAAGKKKKALGGSKATAASASELQRPSGFGEGRTSRDSQQLKVSKRRAEELSSSDYPSEPANRSPAPGHLFGDGPEARGTTGEIAAQSSPQLGPTEGGLAYATTVAGVASLQQPSGPHKSTAKGSIPTEHAASPETAARRMSHVDKSGILGGMPEGTTTNAQVAPSSAAPGDERQNKTPIYISGVTNTRGYMAWLRASCKSGLSAQLKGENIVCPTKRRGFPSHIQCAAIP
jgi:hypothetical protein